jgi:hypothetical protein
MVEIMFARDISAQRIVAHGRRMMNLGRRGLKDREVFSNKKQLALR